MTTLYLDGIPEILHKQARDAFAEGNPKRFFGSTDSMCSMGLFHNNRDAFEEVGLYEKALLTAWANQKWTIAKGPNGKLFRWDSWMRIYLSWANRETLLEVSDPLPPGDVFTIYRGVGGTGDLRALRGVAWSLSPRVATMFAQYGLNHARPALYKTTVNREDVFAYINESGRREQEVLVLLEKKHPVQRLPLPCKCGEPLNFEAMEALHKELVQ